MIAELPRPFWKVAIRPRMLALLLLLLFAAAVCARLGVWQFDRAHERADLAAHQRALEVDSAAPEGLGAALRPQAALAGELVGRRVWVEGDYEPSGQLLVADRTVGGREGYLVLTPLRVSDDGTGGASWHGLSGAPVVAVVRGWVATPDEVPPAPAGAVRLTGFLQAPEAAGAHPIGPGVTDSIAPAALVGTWGGPIYSAYLVAADPDPALVSVPRPTVEGGAGLSLQNAFYAVQWWVFGGFALALWARTVRDEARGGRRRTRGAGIAGIP